MGSRRASMPRLRRAGSLLYQPGRPNAESLTTNELATIYLLSQAWQRLDQLAPALQADVGALLGWTVHQDEVLRQPGVKGYWRVLAQVAIDEERLRMGTTWLRGGRDARWALPLQYAAGTQGLRTATRPRHRIRRRAVLLPQHRAAAHPRQAPGQYACARGPGGGPIQSRHTAGHLFRRARIPALPRARSRAEGGPGSGRPASCRTDARHGPRGGRARGRGPGTQAGFADAPGRIGEA
jgi:hypothetical protein